MCPKCKTGSLSPATLGSSNWRCNVCGYTEYRPSPSVDTSSSRQSMNSAMSRFNSASNDVGRALRSQKAAMREYENARKAQKQEKGGKGGWLVVVIVAIIVFWLLSN
ncbi:MAG: hypothetical protein K2N38_05085 [Oscillospiraceae bacterium]|nr:hypothetical protein [Oscillospiraceae bacterium]